MSEVIVVTVHEVATDGLPNMEVLTGRVAFIFDGCVVSGWPIAPEFVRDSEVGYGQLWEGNSDVGHGRPFANVTHWLEFPLPVWEIGRQGGSK